MTSTLNEQSPIIYILAGLEKVSVVPQVKKSRGEKVVPLRLIKLELFAIKIRLCALNARGFGRAQDLTGGRQEFLASKTMSRQNL